MFGGCERALRRHCFVLLQFCALEAARAHEMCEQTELASEQTKVLFANERRLITNLALVWPTSQRDVHYCTQKHRGARKWPSSSKLIIELVCERNQIKSQYFRLTLRQGHSLQKNNSRQRRRLSSHISSQSNNSRQELISKRPFDSRNESDISTSIAKKNHQAS